MRHPAFCLLVASLCGCSSSPPAADIPASRGAASTPAAPARPSPAASASPSAAPRTALAAPEEVTRAAGVMPHSLVVAGEALLWLRATDDGVELVTLEVGSSTVKVLGPVSDLELAFAPQKPVLAGGRLWFARDDAITTLRTADAAAATVASSGESARFLKSLVAAGAHVYALEDAVGGARRVVSFEVETGTRSTLRDDTRWSMRPGVALNPQSLAVSATHLAWVSDTPARTVSRLPMAGGSLEATGLPEPSEADDDTWTASAVGHGEAFHVACNADGQLHLYTWPDGQPARKVWQQTGAYVRDSFLRADERHLYYVSGSATAGAGASIMRVAFGEQRPKPEQLATVAEAVEIALGDGYLYWLGRSTGTIWRLRI